MPITIIINNNIKKLNNINNNKITYAFPKKKEIHGKKYLVCSHQH